MNRCRVLIAGGFVGMMAVILAVLAGRAAMGALPYALAALLLLCVLLRRAGGRGLRFCGFALWPLLFAVQAVLSFHAYFMTGWDVKTILESAYAVAGGEGLIDHYYFSLYPNNAFLTILFAAVIRLLRLLLGNPGLDRCVYVLILMQCALNTLAGMMTWRLSEKWTGSSGFALLAALVYSAFIGLSPWLLIPYSDSMALIFPVAILTLYDAQRTAKRPGLHWLGIGLCTAAGYMIKPQAAIASIAVVIVEAIRQIEERKAAAFIRRAACVLLCVLLFAGSGLGWLTSLAGIAVRPGNALGMGHFAMMGLSTRTGGQYDEEDLALSLSESDPDARRALQLGEIADRLREMGPGGLLAHLARKTVVNYGDGTFAWAGEGNFFAEMIEDKDDVLSPTVKDMIGCGEGRLYPVVRAYFQGIWLALLIGTLGMALAYKKLRDDPGRQNLTLAMMLSVIGLTVFELMFEARARYLFAYAPIYVLLGLAGIWYTAKAVAERGGRR